MREHRAAVIAGRLCGVLHPGLEDPLERRTVIYASSVSRRDLARRRARMRHGFLPRPASFAVVGLLAAAAVVVERLFG